MAILQIWLWGLVAGVVLMLATWAASAVQRDASLVDRVWGLSFVVAAWVYVALAGITTQRSAIVVALVSVWGVRLSVFITWRNWGHGEDKRYAAMRDKRPETFTARSLVTVFTLQGVLSSVVAVALLGALALDEPRELWWLDGVAVAVWVVGFVFESIGDLQLARFRARPDSARAVLDTGLWRYTRHPNYFGDATVWASFGLFSLAAGAWWGLIGALIMGVLIVKVSGVALTDRSMAQSSTRAGYDEYVRRTNAFFPGPRRA